MDFHILIVISIVLIVSLLSLILINKFFRRKTFEEVIAEKKALSDKIYGQNRAAVKKPKKLQQSKKEQKREKKQRQKEQQKDVAAANATGDDSDAPSEQASVDDESSAQPLGLSKVHVEFEPDPEILNERVESASLRRESNSEKENTPSAGNTKSKSKRDKKNAKTQQPTGILVNKNEPVVVKENAVVEELNHFEAKHPKDVVELKKQEKDKKEEKLQQQQQHHQQQHHQQQQQQQQQHNKKEKNVKKDKQQQQHGNEKQHAISPAAAASAANTEKQTIAAVPATTIAVEQPVVELAYVATKELKQNEEKIRYGSPKNAHNTSKAQKQQNKKQNKDTAATKELILAVEKLSDTDTIGVTLLMNLFRRAELNRSEIQILIDYLLNRQQDMPNTHSEWSDDVVQKLKRQLEEKERLLTEEQKASIGIQAKLRDLRSEVNAERVQMNATIKAYSEKLQSKDQEIAGLNQELQTQSEKLNHERQQFQAKLLREKQAGSQDLLAQLQMMQQELAHKEKCINDLTCLVNASRQAVEESQTKSDIIQNQAQQILTLEQQRSELEQVSNNRIFELEKLKTLETEMDDSKVELRNLQNALESSKADLIQSRKDLENLKSELNLTRNVELVEKQNEIQGLQSKNDELTKELNGLCNENAQENTSLKVTLETLQQQLSDKIKSFEQYKQQQAQQQQELQQLVETLKTEVAQKKKKLFDIGQSVEKYSAKEAELLQQLHEQRERNNDLRMKNWKLVEALQNAEATVKENKTLSSANANLVQQQQMVSVAHKQPSTTATGPNADQKHIRELFQRLYPDAVKACAATALTVSFDQWIEQVLNTHIKQSISKSNANNNNTTTTTTTTTAAASNSSSSSNKSTQSNSNINTTSTSTNTISSGDDSGGSNNSSSNHNNSTTYNSHNNSLINSEDNSRTNSTNSNSNNNNNNNNNNSNSDDTAEMQKLQTENSHLRAQIDELKKIVTKTSNTLSDLEGHAREQDEHWRSIVQSKDEIISSLQHSNGEQDI